MQLREAHAVRVLDDERVGVRHVHTGFDDGGAYQHIDFVLQELPPDLGELVLRHLAVAEPDARLRNLRLDARGGALDGRHVVVQVVDLAAAPQFPADGLVDDRVVVFQHIGLHRMAVVRRFFNDAHVADAGQRHI